MLLKIILLNKNSMMNKIRMIGVENKKEVMNPDCPTKKTMMEKIVPKIIESNIVITNGEKSISNISFLLNPIPYRTRISFLLT